MKKLNTWENTDICSDKYKLATTLYLLLMQSHAYRILIDCGIVAPGYGKYVVDVLDATSKSVLSMLRTTAQLNGAATNY